MNFYEDEIKGILFNSKSKNNEISLFYEDIIYSFKSIKNISSGIVLIYKYLLKIYNNLIEILLIIIIRNLFILI